MPRTALGVEWSGCARLRGWRASGRAPGVAGVEACARCRKGSPEDGVRRKNGPPFEADLAPRGMSYTIGFWEMDPSL
ncbi:hypothetical protein WOLCODRAFT_23409 [Wolfiporia cocos MD-104 SS10]|uniref:Uncharacterized protein n=1 Tax=Wolfiporia cocos (strain MD-104) TaxID=742152 RepID=A0A2H3J8E2_WOLCO|nr:hypothetical protein WOLCODRAFT_23409 [Wolfiporia cocos MD-104 SS10]